jgi:hypothetical protein
VGVAGAVVGAVVVLAGWDAVVVTADLLHPLNTNTLINITAIKTNKSFFI